MPRASSIPDSASASSEDVKPYSRTTPTKTKANPNPKGKSSPGKVKVEGASPSKNKAWTGEEYVQLFERVQALVKNGGRICWDGAVEGRNPNQCYQAWIGTVAPHIKRSLAEKGKK